jgi:hypothetical protein
VSKNTIFVKIQILALEKYKNSCEKWCKKRCSKNTKNVIFRTYSIQKSDEILHLFFREKIMLFHDPILITSNCSVKHFLYHLKKAQKNMSFFPQNLKISSNHLTTKKQLSLEFLALFFQHFL